MGKDVGDVVIEKAISEVVKELDKDTEDFSSWFEGADETLKISYKITQGFQLVQAVVLCKIQDKWDQIPLEVRKRWNYQFRLYALDRVGNAFNYNTLQNHMRAARTFVFAGIQPKEPVQIEGEVVEFKPTSVGISKLVVARSAAERGEFDNNPELWKTLLDEESTVEDLKSQLFDYKKTSPEIKYMLVGPTLIASRYEEDVVIIDENGFNWELYYDEESEHHELAYKAIRRIMACLNIVMDEEIIDYENRKTV